MFLRSPFGIVEHVNMFHLAKDFEGIYHESTPVVVLENIQLVQIQFKVLSTILLSTRPLLHNVVNSTP